MPFKRLGCFTGSGIFAAIFTIILVGGFTVYRGGGLFSPGPLNAQAGNRILGGVASHAELREDCAACHTSFWSGETMQDRCLACHTDLFENEKTFHSVMLAESRDTPCQDCHTEHNGPEGSLTNERIGDFPHDLMGFSLALHLEHPDGFSFACSDCHQETFTGFDQQECMECHLDLDFEYMKQHAFDFGDNCLACHDGHDRFSTQFDHDRLGFRLVGLHKEVRCAACHTQINTLEGFSDAPGDCTSCHGEDNPHEPEISFTCETCHAVSGWEEVKFDHSLSDFALIGAHVEATCTACHASESGGPLVFRATPEDCAACHLEDDKHEGELGTECSSCHIPESWDQVTFDHAQSAFALTGKHVEVTCEDCHLIVEADRMVFRGIPQDCYACHQDDDEHQGDLGTECSKCHSTQGWGQVTFDHAQSAFPLTGKHLQVSCEDCHLNAGTNRMVFRNIPQNCYACHRDDDEHQGELGTQCSTCHTTANWSQVTFDHNRSSFPLTGSHSSVACRDCHFDTGRGRMVFQNIPQNCYACHAGDDKHNGQFGTDCAACHTTSRWNQVTFDHSGTSFPLTGSHASVSCQSCHSQGFSGTPTNCYACHAGDDEHEGQFGTNCSSCHNTSKWSDATFDHSSTSFPLTGSHTSVSCQSCHSQGFSGTPTNCYACHAGDDEHGGQFGTNCSSCHNTSKWSDATFDHNNTSFPLTGSHASVSCQSCHSDGFSGIPTNCYACHAGDDEHNGQLGTDCAACHSTSNWGDANFNHTFPINHGERDNSCQTCHPSSYSSYTCYNCHEHDQTEVEEEHRKEGITDFQDCMRCHPDGREHD